jgi:hypothetical protein
MVHLACEAIYLDHSTDGQRGMQWRKRIKLGENRFSFSFYSIGAGSQTSIHLTWIGV